MEIQIRPIVLIPRYSTYAGARTFLTVPISVREFAYANVSAWRGAGLGSSSPAISMQFQASSDLQIWADVGTAFGSTSDEEHQVITVTMDWLRCSITLTGVEPAFTCWAVGDFATRIPVVGGGGG